MSKSKARTSVTAISLFCGAGGMDLGFEKAGVEVLASVDFDDYCRQTFEINGRGERFFHMEVREYLRQNHRDIARLGIDIVFGGPPCQGFSTSGKRDPKDPRNKLWLDFMRAVEIAGPRIVVFENVPGLAAGHGLRVLSQIIEKLNRLGYNTHWEILNSADFGVPQSRKRLILIGALPGIDTDVILRPGNYRHVGVAEALDPLKRRKGLHNHEKPVNHPRVRARWRKLAPGESDENFKRVRLDPLQPSPTIRAGGQYSPGRNGLSHLGGFHPPFHHSEPRQLTVREAAVLQGFPVSYRFAGTRTMAGRQVGNAVPVGMAKEIAKRILDVLRG